MKEKLHQELQRLAKHILDANHSSELAPLYETAKTLYEKLAVLKFISQNLGDPHLDTEENQIAQKFQEMANEVLSSGEEIPESNPHESDIMTPGMDTIIDMVSHMPKKESLPTEYDSEPPQELHTNTQDPSAGRINTATTLNGRYGQQISFGLNDQIAFVKELFNGEEDSFKRVVSQLNTIDSKERAMSFIGHLVKPEYNDWKGKEAYEKRFIELITQKYH
ncbi:hypothetical protein OAG27_05375 [Flavobacteriaceae bacterium]|nr:hypothetical protein [Flavobacteriaceae bacterium]